MIVKRLLVVVTIGFLVASNALDAGAQAKDPFRPPPEAGPGGGAPDPDAPAGIPEPSVEASPGDGLARTGQDIALLLSLGVVLLLFGAALRATAAALDGTFRRLGRVRA